MLRHAFAFTLVLLSLAPAALAARDPNECEVCISALTTVTKAFKTPAPKMTLVEIEEAVGKYCDKPPTEKEAKLVSCLARSVVLRWPSTRPRARSRQPGSPLPVSTCLFPPSQCYYLDPIKREISTPLKNGAPVPTVCQKLKKKSAEICTLKFASSAPAVTKIDKSTDLAKLKVAQLKAIIAEKNIPCSSCLEKEDMIAHIKAKMEEKGGEL